ncbi:FeoA domain-containing protein [Campylobacter coli]|nr:FeoA domain-containing protein [Campylobacter coli]
MRHFIFLLRHFIFPPTKELKNRLLSFGFIKNKNLKKIHSSLKNATIMVELDTSCVILRSDEAKTIEVNLI